MSLISLQWETNLQGPDIYYPLAEEPQDKLAFSLQLKSRLLDSWRQRETVNQLGISRPKCEVKVTVAINSKNSAMVTLAPCNFPVLLHAMVPDSPNLGIWETSILTVTRTENPVGYFGQFIPVVFCLVWFTMGPMRAEFHLSSVKKPYLLLSSVL